MFPLLRPKIRTLLLTGIRVPRVGWLAMEYWSQASTKKIAVRKPTMDWGILSATANIKDLTNTPNTQAKLRGEDEPKVNYSKWISMISMVTFYNNLRWVAQCRPQFGTWMWFSLIPKRNSRVFWGPCVVYSWEWISWEKTHTIHPLDSGPTKKASKNTTWICLRWLEKIKIFPKMVKNILILPWYKVRKNTLKK